MSGPRESSSHGYEVETASLKLVSKYLGISVLDVYDLCITDYMAFLRDAFIDSLDSHEQGREALADAWRKEKYGGKADRAGLRALASQMNGG